MMSEVSMFDAAFPLLATLDAERARHAAELAEAHAALRALVDDVTKYGNPHAAACVAAVALLERHGH